MTHVELEEPRALGVTTVGATVRVYTVALVLDGRTLIVGSCDVLDGVGSCG